MTDPFEQAEAPMRVLVVEDEPRLRDMLERALPDMGFTGQSARSGEEAIKRMEQGDVDIIVLDLNLPGMTGLEFFEQVRQRWPKTQVVILTGYGDLETAQRAIQLDVAEFLTKPCPLGDLENALDHARRRLEQTGKRLPDLSGGSSEPAQTAAIFDDDRERQRAATSLRDIERDHILSALRRHEGNRQAAAEELGISVRKLYYRLAEYQNDGYEIP